MHIRSRAVLALVVAAMAGTVLLAGGAPDASSSCCGQVEDTFYYSDATFTQVVGECTLTCPQKLICRGAITHFAKTTFIGCCPCS